MRILWRVLAPLKYKSFIEAFNQCNTEQSFTFFKDESYDPSPAFLLSQFYSVRKRKNTKRFEVHRLKIKLQNESNVNILKLCFFHHSHTTVFVEYDLQPYFTMNKKWIILILNYLCRYHYKANAFIEKYLCQRLPYQD